MTNHLLHAKTKQNCIRKCFLGLSIMVRLSVTGSSKIAYMISDGIGPYFTSQLVKDVKKSGNMYIIHFDETTTVSVMTQIDLLIRYWNERDSKIVVQYLSCVTFDHADAEHIVSKGILETLDKFSVYPVMVRM